MAEKMNVSRQAISRWENGASYPDLELIPTIAKTLGVTVDILFGIPEIEKEKSAEQAFDALRRECIKYDYDADIIVDIIRDIRRNYMHSESAWRPWSEGNGRAFRDPVILPEVRLMAEEYLTLHPMWPHTIRTMVEIEDDDHLRDFLKKYTTPFACSARELLFNRYRLRGEGDKFDKERKYLLYSAFNNLLCPTYLLPFFATAERRLLAFEFIEDMLSLIRKNSNSDKPDIWVSDRMEVGIRSARLLVKIGKKDEAIQKIKCCVELLEDTMKINEQTLLSTSCRFLEGMIWYAHDGWTHSNNNPDELFSPIIFLQIRLFRAVRKGLFLFPRSL
mgnify:CR=1 FL=1